MFPDSSQQAERYVIESRVGGGASGDIYKGLDTSTGQPVALKVLRQGATEGERARFQREIDVVADLRHPNIISYVSHGQWSDGRPFLAMEWLEGEDLSQRQRRAPLGTRDAVEVVRRAAQAIAAMHSRGIVHRDLKLSNIFLVQGRGTAVKMIDFGVVKPAAPDEFQTEPGTILGTPHYMAPEQARGEDVDTRADVYSLGSVLFRLLTGRNVFETEHVIALLGRLVIEDPPPPSSLRFDIPEKLDKVVHRAIQRDREQRYTNAGEFARALARVGPLTNDPPSVERSASAVLPRRKRHDSISDTGSTGSRPTRPGIAVRRVVACVLYDLGDTPAEQSISDSLIDAAGEDVRIEPLAGGKTVAVLGIEHSRGDEILRAARAALTVVSEYPHARVVVSNGHAAIGRGNLAGEALDRAAAQFEHTGPGVIRLDLHAAAAIEARFRIERDAHGARLIGEDPRGLGPRELLGRLTPTVGREKEIGLLQAVYADLLGDSFPRAALVTGTTGIGKSRLCSELLQRLELSPAPPEVLVCRGDPRSGGGDLSILGRALRAEMGVQDGMPHVEQLHRVKRYVRSRLPRSLHFLAAFVGELVGVRFPDEHDEPLRAARQNEQLMQARIRMALEAYVRTQAGRSPQVLVIEDAQWADDTTVELADWLLACNDIRLCVFAFARREIEARRPNLWARARLTRLGLGPLAAALAERIVATVLPDLPAEARADLVGRAGGNPLVLEELVRCAAEGRTELPVTVQALVQARLDRLAPDVKEALHAAAVFGPSFWTGGVSALLERDVSEDLVQAEQHELVARQPGSRVAGQDEWLFRQAVVRDAAYESLLEEDRGALHLAAGAWLEAAGNVDLGLIAGHYHAGGDRERAAALYAAATRQALSSSAHVLTVLELAQRGLECGATGGERAQLLVALARVHNTMGKLGEGAEAAEQAAKLVPPASELWVEAQRLLASCLIESGRAAEGDARAAWALGSQFAASLDHAMRSVLLATRVRGLAHLNRPAQALEIANDAVQAASFAGIKGGHAMLRALDAQLFALMNAGQPAQAIAASEHLIEAADRAGDIHLASRARLNTASALNYLARYEEAQALIERALPDVRSFRLRILEGSAIHNLGMSYARRGALDEAIEMQRQAAIIADECGSPRLGINARLYEALHLVWRGEPGDLRRAHELAQQILESTQPHVGLQVPALYCLAQIQLARGEADDALAAAREAHRRLSLGPVEEWDEGIRLCFVEALLAKGETEEADQTLRDAFEAVSARAAAIARPDYRDSFVARNDEVCRLLRLADARLGLRLDAPNVLGS
ncbi:MAG: protein kinase [Deltaproteobacteria bacterium]|nr:protein kinase [Deltaproteobacteria bacterium]